MQTSTLKFFTVLVVILFNVGFLKAQTVVNWPLNTTDSLNAKPASGTGFTATKQTQSVLTAISWTGFGSDGNPCERVKTTDASRSIPSDFDNSTYVEYAVTAATGYRLTVSQIQMYIAGGGTTGIYAMIKYSTDNFVTSTTLLDGSAALGSNSATTIDYKNYPSLSIIVPSGSSLKVRVYPKNTGGASTTKYLINSNVSITFTAATGTGLQNPSISGVTFDGSIIHNDTNVDLQVYNVTGHRMFNSNQNIDMRSCAKGIYIVKSATGTLKFALE
jgi:hypothetical protein